MMKEMLVAQHRPKEVGVGGGFPHSVLIINRQEPEFSP